MNNPKTDNEPCNNEEIYIGDRNALIFSFDTAHALPKEDLSDEFFEVTEEDARKILRDVIRQREQLEEGGPLVTAKLREAEKSQKLHDQLDRYKKSVIRVMFPDRLVLQAVFTPTETIKTVLDFVSQHLEDKSISFYLFTTPPKCILPEDKQLIEVNCVPGALLHFGTCEPHEKNSYLKPDLMEKSTTHSKASLEASKVREQTRRVENETKEAQPGCSKFLDAKKESASVKKVPKWFKPV